MAKNKVMDETSAIASLQNQGFATVIPKSGPVTLYTMGGVDIIGIIDDPLKIKLEGKIEKDVNGNYWGCVYIPPDPTYNKDWTYGFYAYINMGTDSNFNYVVPINGNSSFLEKEGVKGKYSEETNDNIKSIKYSLVNQANLLNRSAFSDPEKFVNDIIELHESGVLNTKGANEVSEEYFHNQYNEYLPEDAWINNPNSGLTVEDFESESMQNIQILRYIFGVPYQFLPSADARMDGSDKDNIFGYTFNEKIASRMPILYITPGNPAFMSNSKSDERKSFIAKTWSKLNSNEDSELQKLSEEYSGKIYTLRPSYNEYYTYVNVMTKTGAVMLGLTASGTLAAQYGEDYCKLDGIFCDFYNWAFTDNSDYDGNYDGSEKGGEGNTGVIDNIKEAIRWADDMTKRLYYRQVIPFYISSEYQYNESFSNETTESQLASTVNGFSDKAREMQFMLGTTQSVIAENFDALGDLFADSRDAIDKFTAKLGGKGNIFSNLISNVKTVATGGRLMFPNIWSNSSFSKSYQCNIKLTTPYYDPKSWWLNIYVPLCHLLALCLPRGEFHNGYSAPFLVKAFYTGSFSIDSGIITELTVTKGKEGGWTKDGLPTVVDVSFTIQDLYPTISMSPDYMCKKDTLENIQELDYLSSLCGININEPDARRMLTYYAAMAGNAVLEIPFRLVGGFTQNITPKISSIFTIF